MWHYEKEYDKWQRSYKQAVYELQYRDINNNDVDNALIEEFKNHMNQDFNVQNVLTLLTSINKEMNTTLRSKDYDRLALLTNTFKTILDVLGINLFVEKMNDEALDIYKKWNAARINKDFEAADKYRNMLVEWKVL